jgi:hypothetical protein
MRITPNYEITGCGEVGPLGYLCTRHEEGQHVARGLELDSFAEAWPIDPELPVPDGDGAHDLGPLGICRRCESEPGFMLTDCPGTVLTAYQKGRVGRGRLDFVAGDWKQKITIPRYVGTFEEVTAFLNAELVAG